METFINYLDENSVPADNSEPLVMINRHKKQGGECYNVEEFNAAFSDFITELYASESFKTFPTFQCEFMRMPSIVYLDIDFHFAAQVDPLKYEEICIGLGLEYLTEWKEELKRLAIDAKPLTFIPNAWNNKKGGLHIILFMDKAVNKETRLQIYEKIKTDLNTKIANQYQNVIEIDDSNGTPNTYRADDGKCYEKLFDKGPLSNLLSICPFAQKSEASRQYKLYTGEFMNEFNDLNILNGNTSNFVIGTYSTVSAERKIAAKISSKAVKDIEESDGVESAKLLKETIDKLDDRATVGEIGSQILDFVRSWMYIHDEHVIIKQMTDHDKLLQNIITPVLKGLIAFSFLERSNLPAPDELINVLTRAIYPCLERAEDNNAASKKHNITYVRHDLVEVSYTYYIRPDSTLGSEDYRRVFIMMRRGKKKEEEEETDEQEDNDKKIKAHLQSLLYSYIKSYSDFVITMFGAGITYEIKPFRQFDEAHPFAYHKHEKSRVECDFGDIERKTWEQPSFYNKIVRTWILQLLWIYSLENKDAIVGGRYVLQLFVSPFVVKTETDTLIYNFRQTKELYCMPYNQYICDNLQVGTRKSAGESYIGNWFISLYQEFIEPELRTNASLKRLLLYFDALRKLPKYREEIRALHITTTKDFTNEIVKGIRDSISISSGSNKKTVIKENAADSKYFPMLNGFITFDESDNGKLKFHKDNYGRYMNGHTLIPYEENYDYNCYMMKRVKSVINGIFPEEEDREYALKIMATYLIKCKRDQFTINYGTGSEGKTVFGDMCSALLGSDAIGKTGILSENGKDLTFINPCGLATTIEPEAVFNEKRMHGHDEGGMIQLSGKRFCVIQEPPNKNGNETLKSSNLKRVVGGAPVSGSHKYGMNETFQANAHLSIQTNTLYNIDDTTNGTARRTIVMPYKAHFIATGMIVSDAIRNHPWTKPADESIAEDIITSIPFRQALFYLLVPYAEELVRNNIKTMSGIKPPKEIKDLVNNYIKSSGGSLSLWLNANIGKQDNAFISVKMLIDEIYKMGVAMKRQKAAGNPCDNLGAFSEWRKQIGNTLTTTFVGSIFKLKEEFISKNERNQPIIKEGTQEALAELAKIETFKQCEYKQMFETASVNNLNMSRFTSTFDDLYILNYSLLTDFERIDYI